MDAINLKNLNIEELNGVINLYPWYGAARKELCIRMLKIGGDAWGKNNFAEAAMYINCRAKISDIYRKFRYEDYSDKEVEILVRNYIKQDKQTENKNYERTVHVPGGDFFSASEYANVIKEEDKLISKIAKNTKQENNTKHESVDLSDDFCTETLAKIYIEQGYYDMAINIYSKLLLKFPKKNVYFANLIKDIRELINN